MPTHGPIDADQNANIRRLTDVMCSSDTRHLPSHSRSFTSSYGALDYSICKQPVETLFTSFRAISARATIYFLFWRNYIRLIVINFAIIYL